MALGTVTESCKVYSTDEVMKAVWFIWTQVTILYLPFHICNILGNLLFSSILKPVGLF